MVGPVCGGGGTGCIGVVLRGGHASAEEGGGAGEVAELHGEVSVEGGEKEEEGEDDGNDP